MLLEFHVVSSPCCVWFCLSCLLRLRRRAWDVPATEVADDVEQSFQDEALAHAPRHRERGSSGIGVMSQGVFDLGVILEMNFFARHYTTLIAERKRWDIMCP